MQRPPQNPKGAIPQEPKGSRGTSPPRGDVPRAPARGAFWGIRYAESLLS